MDDASILAIVAASLGMTYSVAHAAVTLRNRFFRKSHQEMVLRVDGETITIDAAEIDRIDAKKLDRAVRAVKDRERDHPVAA